MKFGPIPVASAAGAVLAHSSGGFKKGRVLSAADIEALQKSGVKDVFAARLEADDVPENEAAELLARRLGGQGLAVQAPFTGRVNLHAEANGVLLVDVARVNRLNAVHESMTLATLPAYAAVVTKQMAATVKIIPFAVKRALLDQALAVIGDEPLVTLAPFTARNVGLVITEVAGGKAALIQKSETVMRARMAGLGSALSQVIVCPHDAASVAAAIGELSATQCDPILLFGASAIVDRGDVIPAAVVAAGGEVIHLGMPVDPGNLMMLGRLGATPVIGVPSCARSPKINGFDWVLQRLLAGVPVAAKDVMAMGAGGLLAEISTRPTPREGNSAIARAPRIAAIVLAAGQSRRMGSNKLLADLGGEVLVRRTIAKLAAAHLDDIIVVTGHEQDKLKAAVEGLSARTVPNPNYAMGLATSLRAGLAAADGTMDAVLVSLADMPLVDAATIQKLVAAFNPTEHRSVCVPVFEGQRGNPVLWGKQHFAQLMAIEGDQGGRALMDTLADEIVEVPVAHDGVLRDADTPEALEAMRGEPAAGRPFEAPLRGAPQGEGK
jgi:molybdenum cofactor cytidylyltransferase